jgi:uncharacterized protein (DUF58 family)
VIKNLGFRFKNIGLYLFSLIILYLAAVYFGGFFFSFFYFFLFLPIITIGMTIIAQLGLSYEQKFDVEYPVKGQSINYHLYLTNRSIFPVVRLNVKFKTFRSDLNVFLEGFSTYLKPNSRVKRTFNLHFEFRGIYNVGLENFEVEDALGFIVIRKPVKYRTIYIYPRINILKEFDLTREGFRGFGVYTAESGDPDYALFTQLNEYRQGESIRHIYWKKFINLGIPFIKQFEHTATFSMSIYLDTRSYDNGAYKALYVEDTSVEILVTLVKHFLDRGIPVTVNAAGLETFRYLAAIPSHFESFYRSTVKLNFQDTISPAALYKADTSELISNKNTLVLITHQPDGSIVSLIEEMRRRNFRSILIINRSGFTEKERNRNLSYFDDLARRGGRVLFVENADTIVEDLRR